MKVQVFISYARRDGSIAAQAFRDNLLTVGADPWLDVKDIQGGVEWRPELEDAIRESDAVLLLLTPRASESIHVQSEIEYARQIQKRVVPLVIGKVDPVPAFVAGLQYIKVEDVAAANAFAKVISSLNYIWNEVRESLRGLKYDVDPTFTPFTDRLLDYLSDNFSRPPIRPEVFKVCIESISRMSKDLPKTGGLQEVVIRFASGSYVTDAWNMYGAYGAYREKVDNLHRMFFDSLQLPEVKVVQFVPIVMTATEAQEMAAGTPFSGPDDPLKRHFEDTVLAELNRKGITDWMQRYRAAAEEWQPFDATPAGKSLDTLLQTELEKWRKKSNYQPLVIRNFVDIRTINDPTNREHLRKLQTGGCVVLVDLLSMCHPVLFEHYRRSLLDVFPGTLMAKIAPYEPVPVSDVVLSITLHQAIDSYFYERYKIDKDGTCTRAGSELEFTVWVGERLASYVTQHVPATNLRQFYHR
jgi:hypothetical protein